MTSQCFHVMTDALRYLGVMLGELRELGDPDLQFLYVPGQKTEPYLPTTLAARDEIWLHHCAVDQAGSSRKYGHGLVCTGATVRILQIPCLGLTK